MSESDLNPSHSSAGLRAVTGGMSPASREHTLDVARQFASFRRSPSRKPNPSGQPHPPTMLTDKSFVHGGDPVDTVFACGPIPPETTLILRTSGSATNVGSFMAISRDALPVSAKATEEALGGPGHWVTCLPTNHIAGFQAQFRLAVAGLTSIDAGTSHPEDFARAADFDGKPAPPCTLLVPTQLRRLLTSSAARTARRFDAVLVGEAAADTRPLEVTRTAGLKVITTYGMTGTCGGYVCDGGPIGDTHVAVRDSHIVLSDSTVVLGYVGDPGFAGTFHTGDIGHLEADRLAVLGRVDDTIATGGVTIIPAVIEEALARSGADKSVVVGVDDGEWGKIAVTVMGATGLSRPTASKVRRTIAEEYEKAYVPRLFLGFSDLGLSDPGHSESRPSGLEPSGTDSDGLPLTTSGKPDRRAVHELVRRALDRRSPSS